MDTVQRVLRKKSTLIVLFIAVLFVVKGLFLASIIPAFQGPDEPTHYAAIENFGIINESERYPNKRAIGHILDKLQFDEIAWQKENTQNFDSIVEIDDVTAESAVRNEGIISIGPATSISYAVGSFFVSRMTDEPISARIFFARLSSVLFGVATVILAFFITRKLGFSDDHSIFISILIAFQPMFSFMTAVINPDASLILGFSIFLYGAAAIFVDGLKFKNVSILLAGALFAAASKGPGIILIPLAIFVVGFALCKRHTVSGRALWISIATVFAFSASAIFFSPLKSYVVTITHANTTSKFSSITESLSRYVEKTFQKGPFSNTSLSYWGNFGWLDTAVSEYAVHFINSIEILSFVAILFSLFIPSWKYPEYLPRKSNIVLLLLLILALQTAIRMYDWRVFDTLGLIGIGQPGRYFLPNLIAHNIVVITGIGLVLRNKQRFSMALKTMALLMILFQAYAIIDVIIPRYYL
jgi:hypothetical protein